jgi:uncharacterized membrane protein (DUF485 family)
MQFRHLFKGKNAQSKKIAAVTLVMFVMLIGLLLREDWFMTSIVRSWVLPVFVAAVLLTLITFVLGRMFFRRDKIKTSMYDKYSSNTGTAYKLGDNGELVPDEDQQVHKFKNE